MAAPLALWIVVASGAGPADSASVSNLQPTAHENMTVCATRCTAGCKTYIIPFEMCYAPPSLFPDDPQWGPFDCLDTHNGTHFTRRIYGSQHAKCDGTPTDSFTVGLGECVGPFGRPRPWGSFAVARNATIPAEVR